MRFPAQPLSKAHGGDQSLSTAPAVAGTPGGCPRRGGDILPLGVIVALATIVTAAPRQRPD